MRFICGIFIFQNLLFAFADCKYNFSTENYLMVALIGAIIFTGLNKKKMRWLK
jgi:hypothetical protein